MTMPVFEKAKAVELYQLIQSGELDSDPDVRKRAEEYVRGYRTLNPQETGIAGQRPLTEQRDIFANDQEMLARGAAEEQFQAEQAEEHRLRSRARVTAETQRNRPDLVGSQSSPYGRMKEEQKLEGMNLEQLRQQYGVLDQSEEAAREVLIQKDETLPSKSGLKSIHRPPEFVALPDPVPLGGGHSFMRPQKAPIYFEEPSVEEFREALRPQLGEGVDSLNEDSGLYQVYADRRWQQVHDQAKANNIGAVRTAFARDERQVGGKEGEGLIGRAWRGIKNTITPRARDEALSGTQSFLRSGQEIASVGLTRPIASLAGEQGQRDLAESELREEGDPLATALGAAAGAFTPGATGVFTGLSRGVGRIPGVAALESKPLGRVLGGGLRGGIGAVGVGAAEDQSRKLASAISTGDPSLLVPDSGDLKRAVPRLLGGGLAGAGAEGLGVLAGRSRDILHGVAKPGATAPETVRSVRAIEAAGGGTGMRGVKLGRELTPIEQRANDLGVDPVKIAREDVEEEAIKASSKLQDRAIRDIHLSQEEAARWEGTGNVAYALSKEEQRELLQKLMAKSGVDEHGDTIWTNFPSLKEKTRELMARDLAKPLRNEPDIVVGKPAVPWNVIEKALTRVQASRFKNGELMYGSGPTSSEAEKAVDAFTTARPQIMDRWDAEELRAASPDTIRVYNPRELGMDKFKGIDPDSVIVVRAKPIDAKEALEQWRVLKDPPGQPPPTVKGHAKKDVRAEMRQAMRDFIGKGDPYAAYGWEGAFPRLDKAIREGEAQLSQVTRRNEALGLGRRIPARGEVREAELAQTVPLAEERAGAEAAEVRSGLEESERGAIRGRLEAGSPEPEMMRELNKLAAAQGSGSELGPALRRLLGTKAVAELRSQMAGNRATITPSGGRINIGGGMTALRLRLSEINRAIERMPPEAKTDLLGKIQALEKRGYRPRRGEKQYQRPIEVGRSIRGGRLGRGAAGLDKSEPAELSPTELMILRLILEAEPKKTKPKAVAQAK